MGRNHQYVQAAVAVGLMRGGAPPSDEQIAAVREHHAADAAPAPSAEMRALGPYRDQIRTWLTDNRGKAIERAVGDIDLESLPPPIDLRET